MTDGCKFGADYLLYPGDPLLYHAQFTVQVLDHQAAIKPALLMGGSRGSHSARKHLLLASVGTSRLMHASQVNSIAVVLYARKAHSLTTFGQSFLLILFADISGCWDCL